MVSGYVISILYVGYVISVLKLCKNAKESRAIAGARVGVPILIASQERGGFRKWAETVSKTRYVQFLLMHMSCAPCLHKTARIHKKVVHKQ